MKRGAGILMPISSLPSKYGIGTLGKCAREFVDFLVEAGQTYWQVLPVGPTGYGNSPYQLISVYAGNPYLIDLEDLVRDGYLTEEDLKEYPKVKSPLRVDYGQLYNERYKILTKACLALSMTKDEDYFRFIREESYWLSNYALFMAIKDIHGGASWTSWPEEYQNYQNAKVIELTSQLHECISLHLRMQYLFYKQMIALKKYANEKGILLIGDLPFYSGYDSLDTWVSKKYFLMNEDNTLSYVAGMPGQKWGNPLFNWDKIKEDGYSWWIQRVAHQYRFFDILRIDHFRGYYDYYKIPSDSKDAQDGIYCKSVGLEPFRIFQEKYGPKDMIIEDLGELSEDFKQFVKDSKYPGMKILQYAFEPNDPEGYYMPFKYTDTNSVIYTGTHDNSTLKGWMLEETGRASRACDYLGVSMKSLPQAMMKCAYGSICDVAIIQAQDILELDNTARMNVPGGSGNNWVWRCSPGAFTKTKANKLAEEMKLYGRYNWNAKKKENS